MADRIAVMNNGVLQQLGTPQDVYNHPANEWVAGFVGEPPMNFMDCQISGQGDSTWLVHPHFRIKMSSEQATLLGRSSGGSAVRMGVRPDQIGISLTASEGAIPADILVTEPLGGDMLVDISVGEVKLLVKTKPDFSGQMGERCFVTIDKGRWHLFAKENGVAYF